MISRQSLTRLRTWTARLLMLGAPIGLWEVNLAAADPTLVFQSMSRAGNLTIEVRGQAGTPVAVELSTTLHHWLPGGSLVLTNGSASFFLRPSENQMFCRVRTISIADLPTPARFSPTPNGDFFRTAFFTEDGGSLSLKDDNGTAYTLTLPEESLISPSPIKLQLVNETSGLPAGMSFLGGAMVEPAGQDVYLGSNLAFSLAKGTDTNALAAIAWDFGGAELHLVPFRLEDSRVVIPIHRLGGFGLVRLNGGDISTLANSKPTDPSAQFDHKLGVMGLPPGLFRQQRESSLSKQAETPCAQAAVWEIFLLARQNELQDALTDDTLLESALHEFTKVDALDGAAAQPCFASVMALLDTCDSLAAAALLRSIEHEAELCRTQKDLKALVRLYRSGRLLRTGRWSRKVSAAQVEHMRDLTHECLNFRVEILSSTAAGSKAGTIRTSVSSSIRVRYVPVTDPALGPDKFRIRGDSELSIDSTAWDNPAAPCTATPAPASGRVVVYHLSPQGLVTDVKNLIIHTDEELPTPKFQLSFDPFLPSPSENYTLVCPPAPPLPITASFWGAAFGGLHKGEVQKQPDGKSVYLITDFRSQGKGEPFRKDYQTVGKADALDVSETTTLLIHYLGGGN